MDKRYKTCPECNGAGSKWVDIYHYDSSKPVALYNQRCIKCGGGGRIKIETKSPNISERACCNFQVTRS